jgi:hypothetical protein
MARLGSDGDGVRRELPDRHRPGHPTRRLGGERTGRSGSPNSPTANSAAPPTAASPNSKPTSAAGSTNGTPTPNPSSGPRPPTRSSTPSPHTARELPTHDTSCDSRIYPPDSAGSAGNRQGGFIEEAGVLRQTNFIEVLHRRQPHMPRKLPCHVRAREIESSTASF